MNNVNRTLYIPLYGKAYVSKRSLFIKDEKAEEIWEAEQFALKRKSRSKWLAFYMGIRSAVFDGWLRSKLSQKEGAAVIHIGCGMDSRAVRIGDLAGYSVWYDVDMPGVIAERRRYFTETERYKMISGDARCLDRLGEDIRGKRAIVVMEGVSMYLSESELKSAIAAICSRFAEVELLMDCYSVFAAKMSKFKNPVNDVGVSSVFGFDDPFALETGGIRYVGDLEMTPKHYVDQLSGAEKFIFKRLYAGGISKKLYKLYEYRKKQSDESIRCSYNRSRALL